MQPEGKKSILTELLLNQRLLMSLPHALPFINRPVSSESAAKKADDSFSHSPQNKAVIIRLESALVKTGYYDWWTNTTVMGMDTVGEIIKKLDKSSEVSGIVLRQNSPGGTVEGTEALAGVVKSCATPIVSFVDGLSASASYWVSSQCDHIMLSGKTSEAGSIGTMLSLVDIRGFLEKEGVQFHDFVSSLSPDKNKDYFEILKGNYEGYTKSVLDPITEIFHQSVKSARPDIAKEAMTGKAYLANEALALGLADSIGTLEDAVGHVLALGKAQQKNIHQINNDMSFLESKLNKAVVALSDRLKEKDEGELVKEDFAPVNEALLAKGLEGLEIFQKSYVQALVAANKTLQSEHDALKADHEKQGQQVAELNGKVKTLEEQLAVLGGKPGGGHSTGGSQHIAQEGNEGDESAPKFEDYNHNKEALEEIKHLI